MAFDMYTQDNKEGIDHHEEALFALINDDWEQFPRLNELWDAYYEGPRINTHMANELVPELLALKALIQDEADGQWLIPVIWRLAGFFSHAHRHSLEIRCVSD